MKYGIAKLSGIDSILFEEHPLETVSGYCKKNRLARDSKCLSHYKNLLANHNSDNPMELVKCPYGLITTSGIGGLSSPIVLNAFWLKTSEESIVPEDIIYATETTQPEVERTLSALKQIKESIREEELHHFEAAIHDARHLNHSILQHSEKLLSNFGFPQDSQWDMAQIQNDETSRRLLSIFAASRDLSQSVLLHEISRDISRAKNDTVTIKIHKQFYRQFGISYDRLSAAKLTHTLGSTIKSLRVYSSFNLIPKILIDNAIKYAERGSEIKVAFYEASQFFIIECKNYGCIVKESEIESLFRRGSRGSNKSGISGEGIGLWLAKVIVEANNGLIHFEVREKTHDYAGRKKGETILTIKLPISVVTN